MIAAVTLAARLPFLVRSEQFFDSDEAVEGLMARHVPGERPIFMWGQNYKGVPEVYVAAAIFEIVGPSAAALKAATLLFFIAFAGVQFVLLETLFSRAVAWLATLFLILGPPVLVYWSLSGSAEIAVTLFAGSVMMLAAERWSRTRSPAALAVACGAAGFGVWVQQFIVYYIVAMTIAAGWVRRRNQGWSAVDVLLVPALLYVCFGAIAFFTGGFDLPAGIGLHHPQKMWRLAAVFLGVWAAARGLASLSARERLSAVAGFVIGYAPAIAFRLTGGGGLPPLARMDVRELLGVLSATRAVPMLSGFAGPASDSLPVPEALALLMLASIAVSYAALWRTKTPRVFHVFLISTPIIALASGAFSNLQSYRHLMPLFAALPVLYAHGVTVTWGWNRVVGATLVIGLLLTFAAQQRAWIRTLGPDRQTQAVLDCLRTQHVRLAYADYWLSYKLTFLADEQVIVAPNDGFDRYPPYTDRLRASGRVPTITRPAGPHPEAVPCNRVLSYAGG